MKKLYLIVFLFAGFLKTEAQNWNWAKIIPFTITGYPNELAADKSGNFYMHALDSNATLPCIIKFDTNGDTLWVKHLPGVGISTLSASSTNLYVTGGYAGQVTIGTTTLTALGGSDVFLACFTSAGNFLWARSMGGKLYDSGNAICTDDNNNVYVTGNFIDTAYFGNQSAVSIGYDNMFLTKYDSLGNLLLVKTANANLNTGPSYGKGIQADQSGNIYVSGTFNDLLLDTFHIVDGTNYYTPTTMPGFLCGFDSNGVVKWLREVNFSDEQMSDMVLSGGGIYEVGKKYYWHSSASSIESFATSNGTTMMHNISATCFNTHKYYNAIAVNGSGHSAIGGIENDCNNPGSRYLLLGGYQISIPNGIYVSDIAGLSNGGFVICGTIQGNLVLGNDSLYSQDPAGFIAKYNGPVNTSVTEMDSHDHITIFPNPTSGSFSISGINSSTQINIYNVLGDEVYSSKITDQHSIDLSNKPKGIYFIRLSSPEGITTRKIIIQ